MFVTQCVQNGPFDFLFQTYSLPPSIPSSSKYAPACQLFRIRTWFFSFSKYLYLTYYKVYRFYPLNISQNFLLYAVFFVTFLVQTTMTCRSKDELLQWFTFIIPLLPCPHPIYTWYWHIKWIILFHCKEPLKVIIPFTLWSACLTWLPNPHVVPGVKSIMTGVITRKETETHREKTIVWWWWQRQRLEWCINKTGSIKNC